MSTELKTIKGRYQAIVPHMITEPIYRDAEISATRFYGGHNNGSMIQLTIMGGGTFENESHSYIQLTKDQVDELKELLNDAYNYEKYPSD